MKKISKVWVLTIVLSVIAAIEGLVVIYDVLRSSPDKYPLATASVAVPRQIVKIQPFIFEMNVEKELSEKLSALRSQINRPLLEKKNKIRLRITQTSKFRKIQKKKLKSKI